MLGWDCCGVVFVPDLYFCSHIVLSILFQNHQEEEAKLQSLVAAITQATRIVGEGFEEGADSMAPPVAEDSEF